MLKAIVKKIFLNLYVLAQGPFGLIGLACMIISYSIAGLITVFYRPAINIIWIMTFVFAIIIMYVRRPSNIKGKLYRFDQTLRYNTHKPEFMLEKLNKILVKIESNKQAKNYVSNYYTALSCKGFLLLLIGAKEFRKTRFHEAINLYDQIIEFCDEHNQDSLVYKKNRALCYSYLTQITKNIEYVEQSINLCKDIIETHPKDLSTYTQLAVCYDVISDYTYPDEYLSEGLDAVYKAHSLCMSQENKNENQYISIERIKGKLCRKMYEIHHTIYFKDMGIASLNALIDYCNQDIKYTKFIHKHSYYEVAHTLGVGHYELYKITGKDEEKQLSKKYLLEAKKYFTNVAKKDFLVSIDMMLNDI